MTPREIAVRIAGRYLNEVRAALTDPTPRAAQAVLTDAASTADLIQEIALDVLTELDGAKPVPPKPERRPTEEEDRANRTPMRPSVPKPGGVQ